MAPLPSTTHEAVVEVEDDDDDDNDDKFRLKRRLPKKSNNQHYLESSGPYNVLVVSIFLPVDVMYFQP